MKDLVAPLPQAPSPELAQLLDQLRQRPFKADVTPVEDQRAGFEVFAASFADPPPVERATVTLDGVPAEWARPEEADLTDAALIWVHGGGFTLGSTKAYRDLAARLATGTGASTLTFDYRLSPEHRFPAALEDTMTVVRAVCDDLGPGRVVLGGDSVGGGIALAAAIATRRLIGEDLAGLALVSPKTDLAQTGGSLSTNEQLDPIVSPAGTAENAARYLGPEGDPFDPAASPLYASEIDLRQLPRTYIQVGTHEILVDDALRLARRMRDAGRPVDLDVWPGMIHILPFFASKVPEAARAVETLSGVIRSFLLSPHR